MFQGIKLKTGYLGLQIGVQMPEFKKYRGVESKFTLSTFRNPILQTRTQANPRSEGRT